jgi:hypothetical protein
MIIQQTTAEPTKQSRSLTSDAEIRQIRDNIAEYPKAKAIADKIIKAADEWVARPDRYVWEMIPPSDIPRAFNSSFDGCPVHGKEYFKHGNYSWKMDPFNKPWKLVCPVGGEEYPSNDFMAYYKTKDAQFLTGDYPDDGWGWRKPGDKYKHWFVAYYCHWLWLNYIIPGVSDLSLAYQITGDEKYAKKATVMLDRIADFYPSMDHNKQSRYAQEFASSYQGKIVNLIWETGLASTLARSYDNVFDVLARDGQFTDDKDSPLAGRTNADIRRNIEDNLLRTAMQAVYDRKIKGNYGTHQQTLLNLAIVLQDDEATKRACDFVLNNTDGDAEGEGFNFALTNFVHREGISFESSPGYCLGWTYALSGVGRLLGKLDKNIFTDPKFKQMFTAPLQLQVMGQFTPAIGDSGSVTSHASNPSTSLARLGLEKFKDPVFAKYLLDHGTYGENTLGGYDDLKYPVLDKARLEKLSKGAPDLASGNKNLGGYGLGILEAGKDERRIGLACYYGPTEGGHAHADRLFLELYGFGKKLLPDLGYPQFAAEDKGRTAWESNTLSHCTVTVNASRSSEYQSGRLNQFAITPDVKLLDVSAPDAYPGLDEYRRVMLLIGGESESPYLVDFFIVKGGHSHDYSLHGFDGQFTTEGINLLTQAKGTLAGEDVPYGYLYDDPDLEKPDKTRSFGSYRGAGYSFLFDIQRGVPSETWSAVWADKDCGIRAIFPSQDLKEVVTASGNPPKRQGNPDSLKYVLLRNSGDEGLTSRFACVLQPFPASGGISTPSAGSRLKAGPSGRRDKTGDQPLEVRRIGDMLEIKGEQGTDLVQLPTSTFQRSTSNVRIIRMDSGHNLKSVFLAGGGRIEQGSLSVQAAPPIKGTVHKLDFHTNRLSLTPKLPNSQTPILFGNANYLLHDGGLGEYTPRTGKIAVDGIDPDGAFLTTRNVLYLASSGFYKDKWLVNEDFTKWHRVENVSSGKVWLKEKADLESEFTDSDGDGRITAYLYDIAPGQEFVIPASCWIGKTATGWEIDSSSPAEASLPDGTKLKSR